MVVLEDAGLPHTNQMAYQQFVSCAYAVFLTQGVIAWHLQECNKVYMCLYNLQKAFDFVEYLVLLEKVFTAGIKGKFWRLLHNWYNGGLCCAKSDENIYVVSC